MIVVGIDPGLHGGIVALHNDTVIEAFPCGSDDGIGAEVTRLVEPRHAAPAMREAGAAGGTTTDPCSSDPAIAATMGRESITATGPT